MSQPTRVMSVVTLPDWSPKLSPPQIDALTLEANTFALSKGLLYLPKEFVDPPTSAIHAPYTLLPIPFPRVLFQEAQELQKLYNILYSRLAMNTALLDNVMGGEVGVGAVDEFTGALWRGWKSLRDRSTPWPEQVTQLGLFRSDYMLDTSSDDGTGLVSLKQVEFNTIAASFGALSTVVADLHKHILDVSKYFDASPLLVADNLPPNHTLAHMADGLAAAHRHYGSADACILMVVQPQERNLFDQKLLQHELLEKHSITVLRLTFEELISKSTVDSITGVLSINHEIRSRYCEVAVVYYRAGYSPSDYTSPAHFQVRFQLESSRSIKCPSIPLQLAGGKKMQEYLTRTGILESVLENDNLSSLDLLKLRQSWVQMWSLSADEALSRVLQQYSNLVLKPQREGGGNNVYHTHIPEFLERLPERELPAWIAMQLIHPPRGTFTHMVKSGEPHSICTAVVSELGVFGWSLFGEDGQGDTIIEKNAGWLVRTKSRDSDEGGVAVGFSVLDSIVLV